MGTINASEKIMSKNQKKRENMEIKDNVHKSPSKRLFLNGIDSFLRRADARWGADIIYRIWGISPVCGSGILIEVKK